MSVDGYIAGVNGEMDWMVWDWDQKLNQYVTDLSESVDCIVLGRKLAEVFIPYWANVAKNPDHTEYKAGKKLTETSKVVFSKTLIDSKWDNTVLAQGDLADEISKLKDLDGKDIIAYGGAGFVSSLIKQGLIDEFHLFVNPTINGNGMSIFKDTDTIQKLKIIKSLSFECGIVVLNYELKS